jgi:hypothetical protein
MDTYVKKLDKNSLYLFQQYEKTNNHCNFQKRKVGFENYVMTLNSELLRVIINDDKLHRDYRAYMREYYNRQEMPWPTAFESFNQAYLFKRELYKNFVINSELEKQKVEDFYKWLNNTSISKNFAYIQSQLTHKKAKLLEKDTYKLYREKKMWKKLKKGENVSEWNGEIRKNLIEIIRYQIQYQDTLESTIEKSDYYVYEILRTIIKFNKCFNTEKFVFGEYQKFIKIALRKSLSFACENGLAEGIYLLAKIRPDMININCYPLINITTSIYNNTDYNRLHTYNVFKKLDWCQEFTKKDYHSRYISTIHS